MKTIESRIAPNPMEAQIWVDLSADAHGLVKKYWNGLKWVEKNKATEINANEIEVFYKKEIEKLNNTLNAALNQYDKIIEKLNNRINSLFAKVNELEQLIIE